MDQALEANRALWAKLLALALLAAVLCNGAGFYLKRTGVIDQEAYRAYWANHCIGYDDKPWLVDEPQCRANVTPAQVANASAERGLAPDYFSYVYQVSRAERPLKLVKDALGLILIWLSAWTIAKDGGSLSRRLAQAWPLTLLSAYCVVAFVASITINGPVIAAAGLRPFMFLPIALLGRWLVPYLGTFAAGLAALLCIEGLLMPFELVRGIHLFLEWSPISLASRTAGTLVQPNSMGVFAAAAMAFCYSFLPSRQRLPLLVAVVFALVLLSGSATGLICLLSGLLILLRRRTNVDGNALATGLFVLTMAALVLALPQLLGRQDLFESLWSDTGRFGTLKAALLDHPLAQVVLGRGLGVNTNLALNLLGSGGQNALGAATPIDALPTDSTLGGLVIQVGILGALLFYASLLWAGMRDPVARPFYAVVALGSLTINVTELFPVNLLLGIAWAHSVWQIRPAQPAVTHV